MWLFQPILLWIFPLFFFSNSFARSNNIELDTALLIHQLQMSYIDMASNCWTRIEDFNSNNTDESKSDVLKSLFSMHRDFIIENEMAEFEGSHEVQLRTGYDEFLILPGYNWTVQDYIKTINSRFDTLRDLLWLNRSSTVDDKQMEETVLSLFQDANLTTIIAIDRIHKLMVGGNYKKIVEYAHKEGLMCKTQKSYRQFFYDIYLTITLTELKGFMMVQYVCMYMDLKKNGGYGAVGLQQQIFFMKRTRRSQLQFKGLINRMQERFIVRCIPPEYTEGKTYERITKMKQGFINISVSHHWDCQNSCDFDHVTNDVTSCKPSDHCMELPKCVGVVGDCKQGKENLFICPAHANTDPRRLFESLVFRNEERYSKKSCLGGRILECTNCFCMCYNQPDADRYFSLREVTSNIADNRVITGLRFRKVNRIMHLQIQEGALGPAGMIIPGTAKWKDIDAFELTDSDVREKVDYHKLTVKERKVTLYEAMGESDTVVTGVRFRVVDSRLDLEVRFTSFEFASGWLLDSAEKSIWRSNYNTDLMYYNQTYYKLGLPEEQTHIYILRSLPKVISFETTTFDLDSSQTTVPYLDTQDVVSNPPVPLNGVGLYHRAAGDELGFLIPQINTYNLASNMDL